jgi:O-antigen/teichoic acid export membrane protein
LKALIKNTASFGTTEIALILVAVIKNKYLAVEIGPEGYGMYSLLDSFFNFFLIFAGGWIANPTMKYISESRSRKENDSIQSSLNFTFSITFFLAIFFVGIFLVFSKFFLKNFLSPEIAYEYYVFFVAAFLGTSLNSVMQSYFQGMLLVKETIFRKIALRIFDLASVVLLVVFFGLLGFFINVCIVAFFGLFIFLFKSKTFRPQIRFPEFKNHLHKKILSFGGLNLFLGMFSLLSQYIQRWIIMTFINISMLGIYRAALTFSNYLGLVGNSSGFFVNAKACESLTVDERNKQINDYIKMVIISSIILFIPAIMFSQIIVHILYSKKFTELAPVLFIFISAQYLLNIQLGIQANIVGLEKFRIYSVVTIVAYVLMVAIPYFFIAQYGILSVGVATNISSLEQIIILLFYLKKKERIELSAYSYKIIISGIILLITAYLICNFHPVWRIAFCLFNLLIAISLLKEKDRKLIAEFIQNKLKRKKK